jgi:hypothetical protein
VGYRREGRRGQLNSRQVTQFPALEVEKCLRAQLGLWETDWKAGSPREKKGMECYPYGRVGLGFSVSCMTPSLPI